MTILRTVGWDFSELGQMRRASKALKAGLGWMQVSLRWGAVTASQARLEFVVADVAA